MGRVLHRCLCDMFAHRGRRRIANLKDGAADQGHFIKAVIKADGSFTVTNGRNGLSQTLRHVERGPSVARRCFEGSEKKRVLASAPCMTALCRGGSKRYNPILFLILTLARR